MINKYTAWIKQDKKTIKIELYATDRQAARNQVIEDGYDESNILFVGVTPTAKQIKQAKNWGY